MNTEHDKRMQEIRELHEALMRKGSHPPGIDLIEGEYIRDVAYLLSLLDVPPSPFVTFNDDLTPEQRADIKRLVEQSDKVNLMIPTPATPRTEWLSPKAGDIVRVYYTPEMGKQDAENVAHHLAKMRPDVYFIAMPDDGSLRLDHQPSPMIGHVMEDVQFSPGRLVCPPPTPSSSGPVLGTPTFISHRWNVETDECQPSPSGSGAPPTPQCVRVHWVPGNRHIAELSVCGFGKYCNSERWTSNLRDVTCLDCLAVMRSDPDEDDDGDPEEYDTPDLECDVIDPRPKCTCPIDVLATQGCQCGGA